MIEAQAEGRARAVESVPRRVPAGSEPVIAFNPHYLLDGLTAAWWRPRPSQPGRLRTMRRAVPRTTRGRRPGLVGIEFTSPAKPALITRVPADQDAGAVPDFRYLVVPLRAVARS